jgi:adenine deaminase
MMNYPAVLSRDPLVMDKIKLAQAFHLPVDGHAPGLKGEQAAQYASAGIPQIMNVSPCRKHWIKSKLA